MFTTARLFLVSAILLPVPGEAGSREVAEDDYATAASWPRVIEASEAHIVVYQPQLETFEGVDLTARSAVSVTPKGEENPFFGAVWFGARVQTDRAQRTVRIEGIEVTDAKFPNAEPEKLELLSTLLVDEILRWNPIISLDHLLTMLEAIEVEKRGARGLRDTPPEILFVTHPAVLVTLDGIPRLQAIEGSKVMRVVNTPFLMLFDPGSGSYYLSDGREWVASAEFNGPWESVEQPPAEVAKLVTADEDPTSSAGGADEPAKQPEIIVATKPTELISTDGEPTLSPIASTGLLYLANTESDVFVEIESQRVYTLIAGRWYAASSLTADDWAFVRPEKLPEGFARIPPESEKGHVLTNVAGTPEAIDAVHESYIPQTAAVDREKASVEVEYDGEPRFEPVAGTEMTYAVNTTRSVIRVGELYYCCHEAVWFVAGSPQGPWEVCDSVPGEIYTIPATCPVYSVRYVYVYHATPTVVYVGYTPGYVGCYVHHGVVVYGTGWYYRPWYRRVYVARPVTWGFAFRYNPYTGAWGVRIGYRGSYGGVVIGYRGGWWGVGGRRRYGRHGTVTATRTVTTPMGTFHREIEAKRGPGGRKVEDSVSFTPNENIYDRRENRDRNAPDRSGPEQDRREASSQGPSSGRMQNNVYADRDGNVHRRSEEGWQQRGRDGWSEPRSTPESGRQSQPPRGSRETGRPSSTGRGSGSSPGSGMERDHRSRQRGSQRSKDFQRSRGSRPAGRRGG